MMILSPYAEWKQTSSSHRHDRRWILQTKRAVCETASGAPQLEHVYVMQHFTKETGFILTTGYSLIRHFMKRLMAKT